MRSTENQKSYFGRQGGYTLMEVVIVVVIMTVLSVVVVDIIYVQVVNFNQVFNRSILLSEWRTALAQLRVDVQEIDTGNIATMKSNRLKFDNFDGQTIDYQFTSNALSRNGIDVAEWVQSDPFQYLDVNHNVTADSDSLKFVQVTLDLDRNGKTIQLSELLYIRN